MVAFQNEKSKFSNYFYPLLICVVLSILVIVFPFGKTENTESSARDVFTKTYGSVVELKAFTNDNDSYGSAVCISSNGEFLTNAHVVTYYTKDQISGTETLHFFENYQIRFPDSDVFVSVRLEEYNVELDLALLKLEELDRVLNVAKVSEDYKTAEKCYAVGNLQNYGISITSGIVSKRLVKIENNDKIIDAIQCDLNITEGNSGGALFNKNGELIGITTFRTKDFSGKVVYGISFSIPASTIQRFLSN